MKEYPDLPDRLDGWAREVTTPALFLQHLFRPPYRGELAKTLVDAADEIRRLREELSARGVA